MTQAIDIKRLMAENAEQERNEAAEKRRLSQARANLKRRMDEIEHQEEVHE